MKFYVIRNSGNKKIIGHYPQVKGVHHNCHVWNEPKFIDRIDFEKIDFEPITSNAILFDSSKTTDLINVPSIGFTLKLLISGKLKNILEKYTNDKGLFFQAPIIYKNELVYDYFIVFPYKFEFDYIDFQNSTFVLKKSKTDGGTYQQNVNVSTFEDFKYILSNKKELGYVQFYIDRIKLKSNINDEFFVLRHVQGGIKYIVSEKLKKEIEDAGCTGIEFMPVELTLNEWLHSEREKIYGKA